MVGKISFAKYSSRRQQNWRQRKRDRALLASIRMSRQPGNGKYVFVISNYVFQQIMEEIRSGKSGRKYSRDEITKALEEIYYNGSTTSDTGLIPQGTLRWYLQNGFDNTCFELPGGKSIGLKTVRFSGRVIRYVKRENKQQGIVNFCQRQRIEIL